MKPILIYVSHPYGGDLQNVVQLRSICRELAKKYPDCLFIPAAAITCREYREDRYMDDLELLVDLMLRCDAVYFPMKAASVSFGVHIETTIAADYDMPLFTTERGLAAFILEHRLEAEKAPSAATDKGPGK